MWRKKVILPLFVALCVLVADQLSKYYVFQFVVENGSPYAVFNHFNIVSAFNKGVSFSMFDDAGILGRVVLIVFALAVIAFLLYWMKNEVSAFVRICLAMIVGGALGNVVDRLRMGAVYDFLDFYVQTYHWPSFNLADTFICLGAFLILVHTLFIKKKD